jgi:small basic protein (TIGR04137 family)
MSLDRSLKSAGLVKHRNVLTRAERVTRLAALEKFDLSKDDPLGLVKVANRKVAAGGKSSKKAADAETGTDEAASSDDAGQS